MYSGRALAAEGDHLSAVIEFRNAARIFSDQAEPLYLLALSRFALGHGPEGFAALRLAARNDPDHINANLLLASIMLQVPDNAHLGQIELIANRFLSENAANSDALFVLANARASQGEGDAPKELLEQALDNAPGHLRSSLVLSRLKEQQKDLDGAALVLHKAVDAASNE